MWAKILLAMACVVFVAADTHKSSGHCPDLPAAANFDEPRFSNVAWYLMDHNDNHEYKCLYTTVYEEDGQKYFNLIGFKNGNEVKAKIPFTVVSPGVFKVTGTSEFGVEFRILDTDYENYCLSYECIYDESDDTHFDRVFFFVRDKHLAHPEETIAAAKVAFDGKLTHPVNYHIVRHVDCEHDHAH